jgi:RNA ligase (TIGR02306 family)
MSTYKVPVAAIKQVLPHPNADKLEIAVIFDWNVVIPKDKYKAGDYVIYCPIDSILPQWLEDKMFGNSKVKLHKHRVRQIKIRSFSSQGLIIPIHEVLEHVADYAKAQGLKEFSIHPDMDLARVLGITKYEPEIHDNTPKAKIERNKALENPYFRKYNGVTNIKWEPDLFKDEEIVIQSKLHGSHIRFGKAPFIANTFWKKVKALFGLNPKYENVYGSNNVELTNRFRHKGFYGDDIYGQAIKKADAFRNIEDGTFVHGELIGPGIQKNYTYGLKEHSIVVFDVRVIQEDGTQKWLNPEEAEAWAKKRNFKFVDVLYKGPFNKQIVEDLTVGYDMGEVREGVVVKSRYNYDRDGNKTALKSISPVYLDDHSNTDFH